jgi:hypothetical protein
MSRIVLLSIIFLLVSCGIFNRRTDDQHAVMTAAQKYKSLKAETPRKRILLLPFINETPEKDPNIPKTGRDALISSLRLTDNFVILDNNDLPKDLKDFRKDTGFDLVEISKMAAPLGVVALIEGRIIELKLRRFGDDVGLIRKVRAEVQATVGLNEVRTSTSEGASTRVMDKNTRPAALLTDPLLIRQSLTNGFQGMTLNVVKTVDKLSWQGKVAMISGDRVYLNAGRLTGIHIGDILKVTEEGDDIFDPDSGLLIGKAPGRMKGTLEVVSYFGKDGCVAVIHSGSGVKENDLVELY